VTRGTEERTQHPDAGTGVWSEQVEALLEDWHHRVYAAQSAHYASADLFRTLNYVVGVPAVIFSSVVGTALFAGMEKDSQRTLLVASTSILAAVLAALQTFLRFAERATLHATAADWYSAIRRDIEEILHLPVEERGTPKDCLDKVRKGDEPRRPGLTRAELPSLEAGSGAVSGQGTADPALTWRPSGP